MMPQSMGSETNIKLPFSFILFSVLAIVSSQIILLFNGETLLNGNFRVPAIWSVAHLFILGWALMIAMGAMYQLVPVAFLTPIWNEKFGFLQFAVTSIGIVWFAAALYFSPHQALLPGIIMLLGILMFLFQMAMTLRQQAKPNILTLFVGSALLCLLMTILIGMAMVVNMSTGFAGDYYTGLFYSHITLGVAGWFTLLIFGFSYKMAPMFALSHGYGMNLARYVYGFYASGLVLLIGSFFLNINYIFEIALFLMLVGFSIFTWHIYTIIQKKVKKKLDRPFTFALLAIGFGLVIHFLTFIASLTNGFGKLIGPLMVAYLMLWIAFSIIGYLYKIVPFLWWTHKYSKEIGKKDVPTLKDMMNEQIALPLFAAFIIGVILVAVSLAANLGTLYYIGQGIVTLAAIVFGTVIISVMKK